MLTPAQNTPVLLLTRDTPACARISDLARLIFKDRLRIVCGSRGGIPEDIYATRYRAILSYLSLWVVPARLIELADLAINFHPGSTHYPGIGCYNFALYDGAQEYGVVCHHMLPKVDSGSIIQERRFPVFPDETVESLKYRSLVVMADMFHEMICHIARDQSLPAVAESWKRRAYTRKELNELGRITLEMPVEEIQRRVRAMTYPGHPGVFMEFGGVRLEAPRENREPIA
jgi:methionyl-tRNA formyltransferase